MTDLAIIKCCDKPMEQMDIYLHCMVCKKTRLIDYPHGSERKVLASLILEYVGEYDVGWTTLQNIIHELWKAGHYEDYEPKVSEDWIP